MPGDDAAELMLRWLERFEHAFLAHEREMQEAIENPALPAEQRLSNALEWETYRRELREQKERVAAPTAERCTG